MANAPKKSLKKGDILFNEGDASDAMYFVQTGAIRLYKKKGSNFIELALIHKGEIIGEMGFLDGGERSASAEAVYDTELLEITGSNIADQMKDLPPWLPVLLKTVVNRLRSTNNKIRQLESATTLLSYKTDGSSTNLYTFLTPHEIIKICTAVLLCGARSTETVKTPEGKEAKKTTLNKILRFGNQIMGVHQSKITEMVDVLERIGLAKVDRAKADRVEVYVIDLEAIDTLVQFITDENQKELAKQTQFSIRGVVIMGFIVKHLSQYPAGAEGYADVNLMKIWVAEKQALGGKEPFRIDDLGELVKNGLASELAMKDSTSAITKVKPQDLIKMFNIQKALKEVELLNEKKRTLNAKIARSANVTQE